MILLIQEIELSVLIAVSVIAGYIIGITAQEEVEELSKKLFITKIFYYPFIAAEIIILAASLKFITSYYFILVGIFIIANLILAMFYSAEKADLQRMLTYTVVLLISNLILGAVIII